MAATIARLQVEVGARVDRAMSGLRSVNDRIRQMSSGAQRAATALAPISIALGAVGAVGLRAFQDYEDALAELVARTGLYGAELEQLEALALRMGETTQFSATEAVRAMLELVASGQTAAEAMETLPHVLTLAAVSGLELGQTADALTDVLAMFNLEIEDAAHVVEALAAAEGASSATTADLLDALVNVGPVARQYGIDIDTVSAALAVLAENGIKGAEAGTALRSMLLNMTRPTQSVADAWEALGTSFYDAEGRARPLPEVLADIREGLADMPAQEANEALHDLAGSYGIVAMNALLGDLSIDAMVETMGDQASAADIAAARTNTLRGSFAQLQNSVEALLIRAMQPFVENTLRPALGAITDVVRALSDWAAENPVLTGHIVTLGAAVVALTAALGGASVVLSGIAGVFEFLLSPIGKVTLVITALSWAIQQNLFGLGDAFQAITGWISDVATSVARAFEAGGIEAAAAELIGRLREGLGDVFAWARDNIVTPIVETINNTDWSEVGNQLGNLLGALLSWAGSAIGDAATWVWENIFIPISNALISTDWGEVGNQLGNLLEALLGWAGSAIGSVATWVWENIITPIVEMLANIDWGEVVNQLGNLLGALLGWAGSAIGSVATWVWENIVTPIVNALTNIDWGEVGNQLGNLLGALFGWAGSAIGNVATWVWENIITPIANTLTDPGTYQRLFDAAISAGRAILAAIIDAIRGLPAALVQLINDAIPNEVNFGSIHIPDLGPLGGNYDIQLGFDLPDNPIPVPQLAEGGIVTRPTLALVGERGPEAIVPLSRGAAGAGGIVINGPIYVQGVQNPAQLLEQLEREARRRSSRLTTRLERS